MSWKGGKPSDGWSPCKAAEVLERGRKVPDGSVPSTSVLAPSSSSELRRPQIRRLQFLPATWLLEGFRPRQTLLLTHPPSEHIRGRHLPSPHPPSLPLVHSLPSNPLLYLFIPCDLLELRQDEPHLLLHTTHPPRLRIRHQPVTQPYDGRSSYSPRCRALPGSPPQQKQIDDCPCLIP